jgi:hypothetical protein
MVKTIVTKRPMKKKPYILRKKKFRYENNSFFEVERICGKKIIDGVAKYFVKWLNWEENTNTWEPLENLKNVIDLVITYEKNIGSKFILTH